MCGHPLYARWRILERAMETVVLASSTGDSDLEVLARELMLTTAEKLQVPADLLERMESDRAAALASPTKRSAPVLLFTGLQNRASS